MLGSLDRTDRQIVALLQNDGRMPVVEMARELGLAEGTIRKRLERMLDAGYVRVTAAVDPVKVDYTIHCFVGLEVEPSQSPQIGLRLAALPEVYAVNMVTGPYDLLVEVVLNSADQMLALLIDRIAAIPGVKRSETLQVLKAIKRPIDWAIPEEKAADAGAGPALAGHRQSEAAPHTAALST
jgi:Lrp/AsnC family transcriptional regulator, regulator for asnA, asnC and gidA